MAIQLDDLVARLRLDTADAVKGVGKIDGALGKVDGSAARTSGSIGKSLLKVTAGLAIGAKAISFVGDSLSEGREANKVAALTEQRIKTMGDVAGISAKGVAELAESISRKTGIDDEQIQSSSNLLLSFSKVSNQGKGMSAIFDRATRASVDLSAGGFGSIDGASKQLGKALQDPVKGISALGRAGVTFTAQQQDTIKKMVESNNVLGAQKIILGEVEKQVGGNAAAQATAADKARVGWQNLQEQIGVALIPTIDRMATLFSSKIVPAISDFITGMQNGTGAGGRFAAIGTQVGNALLSVAQAIGKVVGFLHEHETATKVAAAAIVALIVVTRIHGALLAVQAAGGLVKYIAQTRIVSAVIRTWTAVQWLINAALTANPIGLVIAALALLVGGLILAYKRSETFRNIVNGALEAVGAAFRWLWNNAVQPVVKFLINGLADVIEMFANMLDALSHVPGFGWAEDAANKLHGASDATHALADGIRDIPASKTVTIDVQINQSQLAKVNAQLGAINTRQASDAGKTAAKQATISLPGIMDGLVNGIARSLGPIESDVTTDVAALMERIEAAYTAKGEAAATRISGRFAKIQERLNKALKRAQKTDEKSDDKEIQAKLDGLDAREEKATARAIARYKRKAKAAKDAARVYTAGLVENARLQDAEIARLDAVRAHLADLQSNLQALQDQAASFATGITESFRDFGKVVGLGVRQVGEETTLTITDLLADLRDRVTKAARLATLIATLTAQGLNQTTIQELLAGGIDAGLATAEAIAAGGQGAVDQINSMTGELTTLGTQLGTDLASTFYGAGISAAQALVDGVVLDETALNTLIANAATLRTQLSDVLGSEAKKGGKDAGGDAARGFVDGIDDGNDELDRAMRRMARRMIRSLRDELDMHSPSRKLMTLGRLGGDSVAMGLDASLPGVERAVARLAGAATFDPDSLAAARVGAGALGSTRSLSQALAATAPPITVLVQLGNEEFDDHVTTVVGGVLQPLTTLNRQGAL